MPREERNSQKRVGTIALRLTARSDQSEPGADLLEGEQRTVELLVAVGRADDRSHPRPATRNSGKTDALGEDSTLEESVRQLHRDRSLAAHHRCDRRFALADIEAELAESALEVARVAPELFDELRLLLEHVD